MIEMKLGTLFYQTFIADPELRPKHFLGTAFPVTPDGGSCRTRPRNPDHPRNEDAKPLAEIPRADIAFVHNL